MTTTYTPIASQTLTSTTGSVTFSNIPQTYRDLILVVRAIPFNSIGGRCYIRFNSNSSSAYRDVTIGTSGTSLFSGSGQSNLITGGQITRGLGVTTLNILDYSSTDKHKMYLFQQGHALIPALSDPEVITGAGRFQVTAAITSIEIFAAPNPDFASGSNFALYGIEA